MSLNFEEIAKQMARSPQVLEATRKKAEDVRDAMELRWPDVNKIPESQREHLRKDPDHTILITESTGTDRPTHVVTVRHPGAVAKQAQTGFASRAVKDVS